MSQDPEIRLGPVGGRAAGQPPVPPSGGTGRVQVVDHVLESMDLHVAEDTTVEHGGVMVGRVDETTGTTVVTGSIRAVGAVSEVASLTFTHETWDHINGVLERKYPNDRMVGWYHSHPHFGIFLSEYDQFIHHNFFAQPWQVAYVRDPLLDQRGFFAWVNGDLVELDERAWERIKGDATGGEPGNRSPKPRGSGLRTLLVVVVVLGLLAGLVYASQSLFGDDGDALTIEFAPADDATGAPGTVVDIGTFEVAVEDEGEVVVTASPLEGQRGGSFGLLRQEYEGPGPHRLEALPPIGVESGRYDGTVTARLCPADGECGSDAPEAVESFQIVIEPDGVAVPQQSRWLPDVAPPLAVLGDEVLVYSRDDPVGFVAEAPGAVQIGRASFAPGGDQLSQVGWSPDTKPDDLTAITDDERVDRHFGFPRAAPIEVVEGDPEQALEELGLSGTGAETGGPVALGVVADVRQVRPLVCRSGATERCGERANAALPDASQGDGNVSVLEVAEGMEAVAAGGAEVILVGFDFVVCSDGGEPAESVERVIRGVVEAHPDVYWVLADRSECSSGSPSVAVNVASAPNALSVSTEVDGAEVDAEDAVRALSASGGPAGDVEAAANVAAVLVRLWPEGDPAEFMACVDAEADDGSPSLGNCVS